MRLEDCKEGTKVLVLHPAIATAERCGWSPEMDSITGGTIVSIYATKNANGDKFPAYAEVVADGESESWCYMPEDLAERSSTP